MFQATHLPCLTASSFSLFPSPLCPMVHIIRSVFLVLLSVFVKSLLNLFCPFLLYFRPLSALTCESESVSRSVVSHSLQPYRLEPARLLCGILQARILEWLPFPSPEDLPDQEMNPRLLHCRQILYQLSYGGSPNTVPGTQQMLSGICWIQLSWAEWNWVELKQWILSGSFRSSWFQRDFFPKPGGPILVQLHQYGQI